MKRPSIGRAKWQSSPCRLPSLSRTVPIFAATKSELSLLTRVSILAHLLEKRARDNNRPGNWAAAVHSGRRCISRRSSSRPQPPPWPSTDADPPAVQPPRRVRRSQPALRIWATRRASLCRQHRPQRRKQPVKTVPLRGRSAPADDKESWRIVPWVRERGRRRPPRRCRSVRRGDDRFSNNPRNLRILQKRTKNQPVDNLLFALRLANHTNIANSASAVREARKRPGMTQKLPFPLHSASRKKRESETGPKLVFLDCCPAFSAYAAPSFLGFSLAFRLVASGQWLVASAEARLASLVSPVGQQVCDFPISDADRVGTRKRASISARSAEPRGRTEQAQGGHLSQD